MRNAALRALPSQDVDWRAVEVVIRQTKGRRHRPRAGPSWFGLYAAQGRTGKVQVSARAGVRVLGTAQRLQTSETLGGFSLATVGIHVRSPPPSVLPCKMSAVTAVFRRRGICGPFSRSFPPSLLNRPESCLNPAVAEALSRVHS